LPEEIERACMRTLLEGRERVFFKDLESRFLLVSAGFLDAIAPGCALEDVVGKTDFDVFSEPHAAAAFADEQRMMATGEPIIAKIECETFVDRPDAWVSTTKLPLCDERGQLIGTWGIARDVTRRVDAERALAASRAELKASERQYRLLFEHNPQPMWVYDRETLRIVEVSTAAVARYGYSREEFLSMTVADLRPAEDVPTFLAYLESTSDQNRRGLNTTTGAWRHRLKDGTIIDVEVTSDDLVLDGRSCSLVLSEDVTERNLAFAELAVARDTAVEASKVKSAFLANMSHEIRTPMNGVIGMNDLLLATELTDEQRSYAEQVSRSGDQMMAIINDILDLSKIEAGQFELDVTEFDVRQVVEQACVVARVDALRKGLEIEVRVTGDVPLRVRADNRRLNQILLNLVSNAVKFTATGSVAVCVSNRAPPGADCVARVEVSDTGIGIDPETVARMFEPFTQADASTTRHYGGTGLGLAIARELVERMGGTIGADSEPGHGSTFWFELPLAPSSQCAGEHEATAAGQAAHAL
jgi:two-component system, sensor histidine kinase and response regulator